MIKHLEWGMRHAFGSSCAKIIRAHMFFCLFISSFHRPLLLDGRSYQLIVLVHGVSRTNPAYSRRHASYSSRSWLCSSSLSSTLLVDWLFGLQHWFQTISSTCCCYLWLCHVLLGLVMVMSNTKWSLALSIFGQVDTCTTSRLLPLLRYSLLDHLWSRYEQVGTIMHMMGRK